MTGSFPAVEACPLEVLFVCTGNLCRSPVAEALLARRVEERGLAVRVASAGIVEATALRPPEVAQVMEELGIGPCPGSPRLLGPADLERADLVIGMERLHVREAVVRAPEPGVWQRSYTLLELLRRARQVGPRNTGEDFASWVARLHQGRQLADHLGADPLDDLPDPFGNALPSFRATAATLATAIDELVAAGWPSSGQPSSATSVADPIFDAQP